VVGRVLPNNEAITERECNIVDGFRAAQGPGPDQTAVYASAAPSGLCIRSQAGHPAGDDPYNRFLRLEPSTCAF
jgi:hypothetical protein